MRLNEELFQQELGALLRYVDLVDEALANVRKLQVARAALLREEILHARLRNVRSVVVRHDEFREVIFAERSAARRALAAVLEVRVRAVCLNEWAVSIRFNDDPPSGIASMVRGK